MRTFRQVRARNCMEDEIVTGAVKEKELSRYHVKLLAVMFSVWLLTSMNNQLFPLAKPSILTEWHLTYSDLGYISSIGTIGSVVGLLTFGTLGDYLGRKKLLMISVLGLGTAFLCSISQNWLQLGIALAAGFFVHSGIHPLLFSLASEEMPPQRRGLGVSVIASGYGIGGGLLASLLTMLLSPISWRLVFLVMVIPSVIVALAVNRLLPESRVWVAVQDRKERRRQTTLVSRIKAFKPLRVFSGRYRRRFIVTIIVRVMANILWAGVAQWFVIFLVAERKMPTEFGAMWFALFGIFGFIGNWINGICADKLGRRLTLVLFFMSTALSILALAQFAKDETGYVLMAAPIGIALLGLYPTTFTVTSELLPSEARAGGTALGQVLLTPMSLVLPTLVGVGATYSSFSLCFSVISVFIIVSSIALFLVMPESQGRVF